jgi:hypothetical protein
VVLAFPAASGDSGVTLDPERSLAMGKESLLERLRRLVAKTELEADTRIYLLERDESTNVSSYHRIQAAPQGLAAERWPRWQSEKMNHLLTLDCDQMPEVRALDPEFAHARGVALFIQSGDPDDDGSAETTAVAMSEAEMSAGHGPGGASFTAHALLVPSEVFTEPDDDEPDDPALEKLRSELLNLPGRALGKPLWIQPQDEADDDEAVIVQLDERFADIELGDRGVMYVLTGGALWQNH